MLWLVLIIWGFITPYVSVYIPEQLRTITAILLFVLIWALLSRLPSKLRTLLWLLFLALPFIPVLLAKLKSSRPTPERSPLLEAGYRLGFPIQDGAPNCKWIQRSLSELESLGGEGYSQRQAERAKLLYSDPDLIIHEEDTMSESAFSYSPFDRVPFQEGGHLYLLTRPEWGWILKNRKNPWTNVELPEHVLNNIQVRAGMAAALPPVEGLAGLVERVVSPCKGVE